MRIKVKCSCGASAEFDDESARVGVNHPSAKGPDVYLAQVDARQWQERHAGCIVNFEVTEAMRLEGSIILGRWRDNPGNDLVAAGQIYSAMHITRFAPGWEIPSMVANTPK